MMGRGRKNKRLFVVPVVVEPKIDDTPFRS